MQFESSEPPSKRRLRAIAVGGVAVLSIAAAGFFYLRSENQDQSLSSDTSAVKSALLSRSPANFAFITQKVGWAVVNPIGPPAWPSGYFVYRTQDGGGHWQAQLHGQTGNVGFMPITVRFISSQMGFLTIGHTADGEDVFLTDDGGDTWRPMNLPRRTTVSVLVGYEGYTWAVTQSPDAVRAFHLYESRDGGSTWRGLPDPPVDAVNLAFRGPLEAWMGSASEFPPHVYSTADGGHTWVRHELPAPATESWAMGSYQTDVQLLPAAGVITTTTTSYTGFNQPFLFTSFDTGQTWSFLIDLPGTVAYQDAIDWWAMKDGVLSKSQDGGQHWRQISDRLPKWQFVPHVIDAQHAWAELTLDGGFGLAFTNDGGLHWARVSVPEP
ncbi:MAG TPA: hypothetical protein VNA65_07505 [Candidatus Dormibacteraeota bacterium]|nr:hypothetical protein [Candidatus Dormibacteraeota bacterium]